MSQIWLGRARTTVRWLVVVATAIVLFSVGSNHSAHLAAIDLKFDIFWVTNAFVATTAANLLLPLGWRQIVMSFGPVLARGPAVRLWCLAQTARYLPTGLLAVASRLQLAARAGVSRSITASSLLVETATLFGWALLVCTIFVPSSTLPQEIRWLLGLSCALGLVASPWLISFLGAKVPRIKNLTLPRPRAILIAKGAALLGASVAARAIGTTCLAIGFLEIGMDDIPLVLGAAYAGVAAGMVGVTPAGIGVREGVMAAILANRFGLTDAAAFALVSRAWEFGFEMMFLAAASWWGRTNKHRYTEDSAIPQVKL